MYSQPPTHTAMRGPGGLFTMARNVEAWLDARGKPAWIAAMVLGFIFVWPVGLALLAYLIWSKRMFNRSCGQGRDSRSTWSDHFASTYGSQWGDRSGQRHAGSRSSGNQAFDAYKEETLRRLQEEQDAFQAFLQRLREAKDKTEFDAFMADRAKAAKPVTPDVGNDGTSV